MLEKDVLQQAVESIKRERSGRRTIPERVNRILPELKAQEPASNNKFFRLAIIGYEIGKTFASLEHAIINYERSNDGINDRNKEHQAYLKNAQLEIGDCFTQLQLLCLSYGFDIDETRLLGAQHLAERHKDFEIKGWCEV